MINMETNKLSGYFENEIIGDEVIFINDLDYDSESDRNYLKESLFVTLKSTTIDIVPSCFCGAVSANYLKGGICNLCDTEVKDRFGDFKPFVWMKRIKGAPPFIAPWFVASIDKLMGKSNERSILRWFGDTTYNPPLPPSKSTVPSEEALYDKVKLLPKFERSYGFFINNLEDILLCILSYKQHAKDKSKRIQYMIEVYRNHKDDILTDIVPVTHKDLIIEEKSSKGSYVKASRSQVINVAETFMRYCNSDKKIYRDRATALAVQSLADMTVGIMKDFVSGKTGLVRKQIMGARLHFSFRQVLTPIMGVHSYDECHMSWRSAVVVFRPHIINKLYKEGYSNKEVNRMMYKALTIFDAHIHSIMNDLINESENGVPTWVQRNPSQNSASILIVRITKIKTNPEDTTVSLSALLFPFMNGDIDGDELNYHLLLDKKMYKLLECLRPHNDVVDASYSPMDLYGKIGVSETSVATITNKLTYEKNKFCIDRK